MYRPPTIRPGTLLPPDFPLPGPPSTRPVVPRGNGAGSWLFSLVWWLLRPVFWSLAGWLLWPALLALVAWWTMPAGWWPLAGRLTSVSEVIDPNGWTETIRDWSSEASSQRTPLNLLLSPPDEVPPPSRDPGDTRVDPATS